MALPFYLAMTAGELQGKPPLPRHLAYMACHFSPYGTGLSNCPKVLPDGSILILNDRTPIRGHNKEWIGQQLADMVQKWKLRGILLDFQRTGCGEAAELAEHLVNTLSCPVIVSEAYAKDLSCPVFLPPVPPDLSIAEYVKTFQGREVWLEMAMDGLELILRSSGTTSIPLPYPKSNGKEFAEEFLHCHYHMELESDIVRFSLRRTQDDVKNLLAEAETLRITAAVGLWQEFG